MNRLLQTLAADDCCVHAFLTREVLGRAAPVAAEHLGVTERTVYNWRNMLADGRFLMCAKCAIKEMGPE